MPLVLHRDSPLSCHDVQGDLDHNGGVSVKARQACTFRLRGRFLTTTRILGRLGSSGGSTAGALACGDMASEGDGSLYPLWGVLACKVHAHDASEVSEVSEACRTCPGAPGRSRQTVFTCTSQHGDFHPAEVPVPLGEVKRHSLQPLQGKLHIWSDVFCTHL